MFLIICDKKKNLPELEILVAVVSKAFLYFALPLVRLSGAAFPLGSGEICFVASPADFCHAEQSR